jgi:hypothetical protein
MKRLKIARAISVHFEGPLTIAALASIAGKISSPVVQRVLESRRKGIVPAFSITLGEYTFKHPPEPGARLEVEA